MDLCRREGTNDMTVLSFPAVNMWQSAFGLTIDGDEHFYVVKSEADQGYYYPVGEEAACRNYVRCLLDEAASKKKPGDSPALLRFVYVPEKELGWLEELGFTISCDPDTSEYVYSSQSLALNDNGSGTNFRVKVRHFSRDTSWRSKTLSFPGDEALLCEKTAEWDLSSGGDKAGNEVGSGVGSGVGNEVQQPGSMAPWNAGSVWLHTSDRLATLAAAKDPAALSLSGVYIETDAGEWAYLLGYPSTDQIYDMSIVKYSRNMPRNAVPVCICEMAKRVCSSYPYINLEDDLGNPGLRRMKQLYHPLFLLDSYTAFLQPGSV